MLGGWNGKGGKKWFQDGFKPGWGGVKGGGKADKLIGAGMGLSFFLGSAWWYFENQFGEETTASATDGEKIIIDSGSDWIFPTAALLLGAGAVGISIEEALRRFYRNQAKMRMEYFQLIPHAEYMINAERISNLVASFHQANRTIRHRLMRGREWFQLYFVCVPDETRGENGRIEIYCGFPRDRFSFIKKKLEQAFPKCGLKRSHWTKVPALSDKGQGGYIKYQDKDRAGFPLKKFNGRDQVTAILDHLTPGSAMAVTLSPTTPRVLKSSMKKTREAYYKKVGFNPKEMRKIDLDPDMRQAIDDLDKRERKSRAFEVKLSVWQENETYGDVVASIRDELNSRLAGEYSGFRLKKTFHNPINITPYSVYPFDWLLNMLDGIPYASWQKPLVMLNQELENLFHIPRGMTLEERTLKQKHLYDRIDHIIPGQSEIPVSEFTQGVHFGNLLNPVQDYRPVYLLPKVVRKHGVIIGGTGSGKTALALMACQSIVLDRLKRMNGGLTIVDPKKTMAYTFLTWLNKLKLEGVLTEEHESLFRLYDVTSNEYCFSINPMERKPNMTAQEKADITQATLDVMASTFGGESILFEKYAGVAIAALLEDPKQHHSILAISSFLAKESPLRDRLYQYLRNGNTEQKQIARDIERLSTQFGGKECETVYNRLLRLEKNPRMKRIFGQKKTSINPLEAQEKGLITIYNIEGLRKEEISLVMGYLLTKYHRAANKRKNTAMNHMTFVDEAHECQPEVMWTKIIPKDREAGHCLWLMTQAFHQFKQPLLDAFKDIGGTFVAFKTGSESAPVVEKATTGRIQKEDAQNYRSLTGAIDTEDSKGDRRTVMVKSAPPFIWGADGKATYHDSDGTEQQRETNEKNAAYANAWTQLGRRWMERDCRPVPEVEKEIDQYLESLWKGVTSIRLTNAESEAAATKEGNIISFRQKEEPQEQPKEKAVNENPFLRRIKQDQKEDSE